MRGDAVPVLSRPAFVAAALLLAGQALAQGESRAVARFRAAFRSPGDTEDTAGDKREALQALRGLDSAQVAAALLEAYDRLEREAEELAARRESFLERGGGSGLLVPLRRRIQPVRDLQDEIVGALAGLRAEESVAAMLEAVVRPRRPLPLCLRIALAARAGELGDAGVGSIVDATDEAGEPDQIVVVLRALAPLGRRAESAARWAATLLDHRDEAVRVEAVRTLAALCWPGSLDALVARLDVEQGRSREEILDALVVLTRADPGDTLAAWRLWLDREGAPFRTGERRLGGGDPAERTRRPRAGGTSSGAYFGIEQDGEAILYVFDMSLSMQNRTRGRTSAGDDGPTRWQRCKAELHAALDGLDGRKTFGLIGFANRLRRFEEQMLPATPDHLSRAHAWLDELELEFQTNVYDALELGFLLAGRGSADRYYPLEIDTLFFLSDGAPTIPPREGRGVEQDDPGQILSAVRRWNPLGRVVVHTVGLGLGRERGGGRARDFLRALATQNGGRFVQPE